jgi:hypothetical protein
MRKDEEWLSLVLGGEYGVETTMTANGLNIHIHALLLVRTVNQSRNKLHKVILLKWNKLTVNTNSQRKEFTQYHKEEILKGNKSLLTEADVLSMNPSGSTNIGLETIFSYQNGVKVRATEWNSDEMIKAIMETISYHFEPHAFDKSVKEINIPLLLDILPKVRNKRLYDKFGILYNEKRLNIKSKNEADQLEKDLYETLEMKVNEDTGELINDKKYFILNPSHVCHDKEKDNNIFLSKKGQKNRKYLQSHSTGEAINEMSDLVMRTHKKK